MNEEESHRIPFLRSPLGPGKEHPGESDQPDVDAHDETLFENPQFQHYEETSNIQLFYDLFFVANLTSFTNFHEVNSTGKLATYIGFFCILWFTWCQVTMYDVRFSTDSIFERVAHTCHFGVMAGLAVIGPLFDTDKLEFSTMQQLSLILMASRFILFLQYSSTLYFSWRYQSTRLPLAAVLGSLSVAVILYLSLSFAFMTNSAQQGYIAWYIIAVFEVGANIAIGGVWHVVSFKGTHLTERMTCLTLIILGEGVIGLTKSITKIENLDYSFSPATIGTLICAILIIYVVYQLYFDNVQLEHFGIMRQQFWTFLHFPFHLTLALLMEGTNQFISWRHIIEYVNTGFANVLVLDQNGNPNITALGETVNSVLNNSYLPVDEDQFEQIMNLYGNISLANVSQETRGEDFLSIVIQLLEIIFDGYGFEPPESSTENTEDFQALFDSYFSVFQLVFAYFFISAGLVLIFLGVLSWLSHSKGLHESRAHLGGIISKFVIGLGLVFLSTMVMTDNADNLGESPWTLPLVFFLVAIALILQHLPYTAFKRKAQGLPTNRETRPRRSPFPNLMKSFSRKQSMY